MEFLFMKDFQSVVDIIITDVLRDEFEANKIPIIYVSPDDIEKN